MNRKWYAHIIGALGIVCGSFYPLLGQDSTGRVFICQTREHRALQAISIQSNQAKYFANLYVSTNQLLDEKLQLQNAEVREFAYVFSVPFASRFIAAFDSFQGKKEIPKIWSIYFKDSIGNPLQYWLLGMNAHICGDMPLALSSTFTLAELKNHKRSFMAMKKAFGTFVRQTIKTVASQNRGVKKWHRLSLGLDVLVMKHKVQSWRRKAFKMAVRLEKNQPGIEDKIYKKCFRHNQMLIRLSHRVWE